MKMVLVKCFGCGVEFEKKEVVYKHARSLGRYKFFHNKHCAVLNNGFYSGIMPDLLTG